MITSRLFRTHFTIAAASILGCVFVGAWALSLVVQSIEALHEREHQRGRQPPFLYVNFIEAMSPRDATEGLKRLRKLQGPNDPIRFSLLDEKGALLFPPEGDAPAIPALPAQLHAPLDVNPNPPPPMHAFSFFPAPPAPPAPYVVIRLNYQPARYLLMKFRPQRNENHGPRFFPLSVLVMIIMVLVGIAVALLVIFRGLREHVVAADRVITELQGGNLKARFPVSRKDDIGNAKMRFNAMADEIERLVERLRSAENSRNNLLQELAHDLRTPVASLGSILETVFSDAQMEPAVAELAELARKEVDYMGHLVEDLLLLAQLSEPSYQPNRKPVDFLALLEEESDSVAIRKEGRLRVEKSFPSREILVRGDEHLFRRLIRNALENASSYAKARVAVSAEVEGGSRIHVRVVDDGPGFDSEALAKFGERRGQRMIKKSQGGRLSLGLGSVIMKSVISLHRGELHAANVASGGAIVEFTLPL